MGRGGMRLGAGRPGWRPKAEGCLRLDVREFARRKLLGGSSFSWHWHNTATKEPTGSVSVRTYGGRVRLDYSVNGASRAETIGLTSTPCGYGGSRPWFSCPRCLGRVAVLFMRGGRFVCRHCAGVAYGSQSEDVIGRTWRRQRKLERLLGENWTRPKGMRKATRSRLLDRIFQCELERDDAIAAYLSRLGFADGLGL